RRQTRCLSDWSSDVCSSDLLELDFLRIVAVLLVLFRHLNPLPEDTPRLVRILLTPGMEAGWLGVDLFFVLSGFLVSGLLFREYRSEERRVGKDGRRGLWV